MGKFYLGKPIIQVCSNAGDIWWTPPKKREKVTPIAARLCWLPTLPRTPLQEHQI